MNRSLVSASLRTLAALAIGYIGLVRQAPKVDACSTGCNQQYTGSGYDCIASCNTTENNGAGTEGCEPVNGENCFCNYSGSFCNS
jgi:hypothetical protein